jgi:hypothetical protein
MNRLVALAMVVAIGALAAELLGDELPAWRAAASLALTAVAVGLAALRTVPNAIRLGNGSDDAVGQTRLARAIRADHVVCFVLVLAALVLQLAPA